MPEWGFFPTPALGVYSSVFSGIPPGAGLIAEVDDLRDELRARGNGPGVRLEGPLQVNQVYELGGEVHVGRLQGVGSNGPEFPGSGRSNQRRSRAQGLGEEV